MSPNHGHADTFDLLSLDIGNKGIGTADIQGPTSFLGLHTPALFSTSEVIGTMELTGLLIMALILK